MFSIHIWSIVAVLHFHGYFHVHWTLCLAALQWTLSFLSPTQSHNGCIQNLFWMSFFFFFFKLCRYINKERKTYFTYTHSILTAVADCDWQSWFTVTRCSRLFNLLLCWICHFWLITVNQTLMCQSDWSIDQSLSLTELVLTVASLILLVSSSCLRFLRLI